MKSYRPDMLQFTSDERFIFKQITNEVQVYPTTSSFADHTTMVARIQLKGFTQYKLGPVAAENTTGTIPVAFFFPETGGNPGRVTIVTIKLVSFEVSEPLGSRTIFGASEASLLWNSLASSLLIFSRSNVDTSGASYYGATAVYFMSANVRSLHVSYTAFFLIIFLDFDFIFCKIVFA